MGLAEEEEGWGRLRGTGVSQGWHGLGTQLHRLMFKKVLATRLGAACGVTFPNRRRHRAGEGRRVPWEPSAGRKLGREVLQLETSFHPSPAGMVWVV